MQNLPHLISVDQFTPESITQLFRLTDSVKNKTYNPLRHYVTTNLFYEPSTRTSSSFYSAVVKLGGQVISINDVNYSSVSKGETLEDTIKTIECYCDAIVLRHNEVGAALRAAKVAKVPIINAGDGVGEHPTQALLDLYTIYKHFDLNKKIKIALVGDLKHGRTTHSLLKLLRMYDVEVHLVSPEVFKMPDTYKQSTDIEHSSLEECIADIDVVYMTRIQRERLDANAVVEEYGINKTLMDKAKSTMILMHPFPRTNEIPPELDSDPRALYFEQIQNGLYIRQAIFLSISNFSALSPPWKNI